jgi:tetratricopeptide (TPR) repeat protein
MILTALSVCLLLAHGDLDEQIAEVTRRIERAPRDAGLRLRRAELHRAHEDWPSAITDLRRAAELDPGLPAVDLSLARTWLQAGDPARALQAADRFLGRLPDHAEGILERARALLALRRDPEAAAEYSRAIDRHASPRPEHYLERSRALSGLGRREDALRGLDEGLRRLGGAVTLEVEALELEAEAGRIDAALERLARIAAAAPRKETWEARRGEILLAAGRRPEARQAFASALEKIEALPPARRSSRAGVALETKVRTLLEELR